MSLAITYTTGRLEMTGYCHTSWRNKPDNGKPTSGYLVYAGWPVAQLQDRVPMRGGNVHREAELIRMALASKEMVYLSDMMTNVGIGNVFNSVPLFGDSAGALHVAGNSIYISRAKHIALRFFLLK